ncbi:MAG TPA: endonuclease MutS2, partial [Clostridiales bacterium]|nr:endonuclease MutS2 [Clostridiales bacterium]
RAFCLATTHYAELKSFAMDTPGVENASCEFDVESLRPTYRLLVGTPGRSNAFLIAERLGLPAEVANAAKALIREDQQEFARMIEKLEQSRTEMEKAKAEADKIRDETKTAHEKALQEKETLLESAKRDVENARMQAQRIIRGAEAVSESVFKELEILRRKREDALRREELEKSRAAFRAT